ncbi:site-specific DNA-methyltransferase [Plectonema cf. radiosum LEGE 06105]|uniref:Methyltransferase n=1 Tax=Plectonema cf. radiosum LEGE 06105 TaxID=945769 RepID=A0A8J7F951_9CYAN|nr:site-specific DNA-methyltransferase [Plectonema radiosum]MBE9214464.1 site-specific DNA-methyltransferase [Plectonema cf. radiosum LEGE 06105]
MREKIIKHRKAKAINFKPYYSQKCGQAYLGDSLKLIEHISDNSINLILTSPPFALTRQKEYGNQREEDYIEWFLPFAKEFKRVLAEDGSFVLDLGGAYLPGLPVRSLYQYELLLTLCKKLGFYLAQELYHYNPARLPTPAEWVTVRRIRVKDSVNVVWWLSKTPHPKADNTKVLKPYSKSMKNLLEKGYEAKLRPSGHDISNKFQKDNKGAIPPNFLEAQNFLKIGNTESNSAYMRRCKQAGIKPHPARFPRGFAEFFIKFLTDENDTILDPFAGSNTTGFVAESLQRRWVSFEINENYLVGSQYRFEDSKP